MCFQHESYFLLIHVVDWQAFYAVDGVSFSTSTEHLVEKKDKHKRRWENTKYFVVISFLKNVDFNFTFNFIMLIIFLFHCLIQIVSW